MSLVVGEDIVVNQILDLSGCTLVGKFVNERIGMDYLLIWIEENGDPILGYTIAIRLLARGWICFNFHKEKYVAYVLKEVWFMDRSYMSIKSWHRTLFLVPGKRPCQAPWCG
jgi:hypothetical protein